jgi:hypothetical protein
MFQPASALHHTTSNNDICEIWNKWMSHLHHGALRILREIVTGVTKFSTKNYELCKGCALGKYTKTTFPRSDNRATGILDLIYSYVCGPIYSTFLSGFLYYVIFIDEFSQKPWIFFMKSKG